MRRKKWMTLGVGVGVLAALLVFQQAAWTRSFGTPVADRILTVARGTAEDPILLSVPGPEESQLMARIASSGMLPDQQERLRALAVKPLAYSMNVQGEIQDAAATPQIVQFQDPATGETLELELFAVEVDGKTRYVVRPDALPLFANPANGDLSVLERNAALFMLDGRSLKVTFLGDADARTTRLASLRARAAEATEEPEQGTTDLSWALGPHWSPDGRYIAFLTNRDTLGEHFGTSIWVHEVATGSERVILRAEAGRPVVVRGWTPDNELIVDDYRTAANGSQRVVLAALGLDGSRRRLATGRFIAQSPDAGILIWLRQRGAHAELLALDLDTGRQRMIWRETANSLRLRSVKVEFRADGRRLVTDLEDSRNVQSLLVYDLETGKRRIIPVRSGSQLALPATWVGDRLLVPLEGKGSAQTFLLNPDEE